MDNSGGIFEAVGHLIEHGHRQITFLAGSADDMQGDTGDRLRAYLAALTHYGLESDPRSVVFGRHVYDGGYAGTRQILKSGATFTAVLASNDEMALGCMQALKETGRKIPQDVAIIGFDNRLESTTQDPPLSSIHIPLYEMGYRAVKLIMQHLQGTARLGGTTRVHTRLVTRESCGSYKLRSIEDGLNFDSQAVEIKMKQKLLVETIATTVLNQAQSLPESECRTICSQLVDSFANSIETNSGNEFLHTLETALKRTVTGGDDAHIWQEAITLLKKSIVNTDVFSPSQQVNELLDQARQVISAKMQHQHLQMIVDQRWASSRLSLLTASLQTALDEASIYEILQRHLLDMNIQLAMVVVFESSAKNPT